LKRRREIVTAVLSDPLLQGKIREYTLFGIREEKLLAQARVNLRAIVAEFDARWIPYWEWVLRHLFRRLFKDIVYEARELEVIKRVSEKMPFVILPSHRSHADYLIFAYLLYRASIPLPYVAAGENMNFWPLGFFFRRSGAFFIRRHFRDDKLYSAVLAAYIRMLLKEKISLEFFLEGGRSRTGKMLMPRYGLLSIVTEAYRMGVCDDIALIPVNISYERVLEEDTLIGEMRGERKKRESLLDLLKSLRYLRGNGHNVYIKVGQPLFVKDYLKNRKDGEPLPVRLAHELARAIDKLTVVTPVSLGAAALLGLHWECFTLDQVEEVISSFLHYLKAIDCPLAPSLDERTAIPPILWKDFAQRGYLLPVRDLQGNMTIVREKRIHLEYYKNTIMGHFIPICLISLLFFVNEKEMKEEREFLKWIFRREFLFPEDTENVWAFAFDYLNRNGGAKWFFASLMESYLTAYWLTFTYVCTKKASFSTLEDIYRSFPLFVSALSEKGENISLESQCYPYVQNAILILEEEGIITTDKRGTKTVLDRERLCILREKLSLYRLTLMNTKRGTPVTGNPG